MRTYFATPEDKQGTYIAPQARSGNPGRNLQPAGDKMATRVARRAASVKLRRRVHLSTALIHFDHKDQLFLLFQREGTNFSNVRNSPFFTDPGAKTVLGTR